MAGAAPAEMSARVTRMLPLSLPTTSFVGRTQALETVQALLRAARIVTLAGPGGIGKTRLALEVAANRAVEHAPDVYFVELAPLEDEQLAPQAVAAAVGVREDPGCPLLQTLARHLSSGPALLVLDNCEHVHAAAALAAALIQACPSLTILATSRQPLDLPDEVVWRVPPLPVPDSPEADLSDGALRLYVDRALVARPSFDPVLEGTEVIRAVCQELDGIPLAIELAAARCRVLTTRQLHQRLDDRFRLLRFTESLERPTRQQTLWRVVDWSHELLPQPERVLWRRLGVFANGFTLDAVEEICSDDLLVDRADVVFLLGELVDKSVVVAETGPAGSMRYRLLETLRAYALARLRESGEEEELRCRAARWCLTLVEQAEPHLTGDQQVEWLARLHREHDQVRSALRWALDTHQAETAVRLAGLLWRFWWTRGYLSEGQRWLEDALAAGPDVSPAVRHKALTGAGNLAHARTEYARASELYEQSLAIQQNLGNRRGMAAILGNLGIVAKDRGDLDQAAHLHHQSLALFREESDSGGEARSLANLAVVYVAQGRIDDARQCLEEALDAFQRLNDQAGMARILNELGHLARGQRQYRAALAYHQRSLALRRELGDRHGIGGTLYSLGRLALVQRHPERGLDHIVEALEMFDALGDRRGVAQCLQTAADIVSLQGQAVLGTRLAAASAALRDAAGLALSGPDLAAHDRLLRTLRASLGTQAFDQQWAHGCGQSLERLVLPLKAERGAPSFADPGGTPALPTTPGAALSAREMDVARLVARGLSNRQVAEALVISEGTAALHVKHILRKLGVGSRAGIASWATRSHLDERRPA